ncbi:hypothetical protein AVEN_150074-1 [Araneus ventricosus]|uniref:Tc1-like transposase DDE domain-containing protein n=1 Tax=Araneus ventricosus TaxID=182803 RepID=A0A4Y2ETA2_ARAVE|nr:hypothetical protein AVEN_150074-1 [Araneus ventricosus]
MDSHMTSKPHEKCNCPRHQTSDCTLPYAELCPQTSDCTLPYAELCHLTSDCNLPYAELCHQTSDCTLPYAELRNGITKPRFVQPGTKINSEYYIQKILKPFLKDDYCRLYPNGDVVFHQDSAPSHATRVTQKFLTDQQVQFLWPQQWMPNSLVAAPCDYFLWGHLKNKLNKRRVSTLRGLQKAIREEAKKIPQEMILWALKSRPKRRIQIYYIAEFV